MDVMCQLMCFVEQDWVVEFIYLFIYYSFIYLIEKMPVTTCDIVGLYSTK